MVVRHLKSGREAILARIGSRFAEQVAIGRFLDMLGPDVLLVPAPRSSLTDKDMNWPALRIGRELERQRLCRGLACLLERHAPVPKSARLSKGADRPTPDQHAASLRFTLPPSRITIVDDVVTRGSTLLGCAWVLAEQFPRARICALAAVRTMSGLGAIETMLDPVDDGRIFLRANSPRREP
jgi:predicted amidophosphoribosyltransferase